MDAGSKVVFGRQESYSENESTGQMIPMSRRKGVFVVRLNAIEGEDACVHAADATSDVREFHGHCKTEH